jgi:hypothetical protein
MKYKFRRFFLEAIFQGQYQILFRVFTMHEGFRMALEERGVLKSPESLSSETELSSVA